MLTEQFDVRLKRARVGVIVLAGTKLQGVDENRHNDLMCCGPCLIHKFHVPGVQCPHSHDDCAACETSSTGNGLAKDLTQLLLSVYYEWLVSHVFP
jgi:hypothetical protein